jgi:hypothetical protein
VSGPDLRVPSRPGGPPRVDVLLVEDLLRSGHEVEVETAGTSMWPLIRPGERLLLAAPDVLEVGQVIAVPADGGLVVHRIVALQGGLVRVRGDNTAREDAPVAPERVCGVVVRQVTRGGQCIDHRDPMVRAAGKVAAGLSRRTRLPWRLGRRAALAYARLRG